MPMIYKRFTEKAAEEWRQIYKGLQLLEFLIKNGSERVIDDARSHLTLLKMLRQFHYIDPNGKDQGVNVRNRAKELADLLSDVERIRAERKKARTTRNKYSGVEGGAGLGGGSSSGSRYGGFGSEESGGGYGGYSGGVYGDGGGFGGQSSDFQDSGSSRVEAGSGGNGGRDRFEEYDEYDEGAVTASGRRQTDSSRSQRKTTERAAKKPEPPKKKEPEVDLFSFDEPLPKLSAPAAAQTTLNITEDDDDFDDFQSATPSAQPVAQPTFPSMATTATTSSTTQYASPQPVSAPKAANLSDLVGFSSISPAPSSNATPVNYSAFSPPAVSQQPRPAMQTSYQSSQPNYFTSVQAPSVGTQAKPASAPGVKPAAKAASGDAFGSLWSSASAGIKKTSTPSSGPALGQLAKEKASAGIWGASASSTGASPSYQQQNSAQGQQKLGGGLDDLLG